jgi:opacity protein-like surface antigen
MWLVAAFLLPRRVCKSVRNVSPLRSDRYRFEPTFSRILVALLRKRKCLVKEQQRRCVIVAVLVLWSLGPSLVQAETYIIPSLTVSERYDTNIWYAPAEFLPPGTRLDDFATTLAGGIQALYKERDIEAGLTAGGDFNAYVYNTGLNYFNTRLDGYAKLDGWVQQLIKGAQLRVADSFRYTPESPGFISGVKGNVVDDPFLRGIQQFRANTFSNTASANGAVPIYRDLAFEGGYSFSVYRVGSILAAGATGPAFFDTTVHSFSAGPRYVLTRQDSIGLGYKRSQTTQTQTDVAPGVGQNFDFTTQSITANYSRTTPEWTAGIGAGMVLIDPAHRAYPTVAINLSSSLERVTAVRLDLSRQAVPSFFFVGGAMISNLGQIAVSHKLSRLLTLQGGANYGFNETVPDRSVKFTNFGLNAGVNYKLSKIMSVDLYYNYSDFKTEQIGSAFEVLKHVVGFSLTAQWK